MFWVVFTIPRHDVGTLTSGQRVVVLDDAIGGSIGDRNFDARCACADSGIALRMGHLQFLKYLVQN